MPLFVAPLFFLFFLFSSFFFPPLSRKESKSKKYVALVDQRRFPLKSRLFFEEEEEEEETKASPNKSSPRKRGKSYARRGMERRKEGRIRRSRVGGYGVTRCKKDLLPLLVSRFLPYSLFLSLSLSLSLSLWCAPSLPERFSFPLAFRSFEVERGTRTEEWSKQKMRVPFGPSCLSPFARREGWNERARTWTNHRRVRSGRDGEEREA